MFFIDRLTSYWCYYATWWTHFRTCASCWCRLLSTRQCLPSTSAARKSSRFMGACTLYRVRTIKICYSDKALSIWTVGHSWRHSDTFSCCCWTIFRLLSGRHRPDAKLYANARCTQEEAQKQQWHGGWQRRRWWRHCHRRRRWRKCNSLKLFKYLYYLLNRVKTWN